MHVQVIVKLSGPGKAQIGVRVGRLLVYVANRKALGSFLEAWVQAGRGRTRLSGLICRCRERVGRSQLIRAGRGSGSRSEPFLMRSVTVIFRSLCLASLRVWSAQSWPALNNFGIMADLAGHSEHGEAEGRRLGVNEAQDPSGT